uniref:Uncharacterized protein n=2 Tax=Lygus hesperus TaxID=30085 RepID=A0A146L4F0_LYGHE
MDDTRALDELRCIRDLLFSCCTEYIDSVASTDDADLQIVKYYVNKMAISIFEKAREEIPFILPQEAPTLECVDHELTAQVAVLEKQYQRKLHLVQLIRKKIPRTVENVLRDLQNLCTGKNAAAFNTASPSNFPTPHTLPSAPTVAAAAASVAAPPVAMLEEKVQPAPSIHPYVLQHLGELCHKLDTLFQSLTSLESETLSSQAVCGALGKYLNQTSITQ